MTRIIAIAVPKGGVGKTTTTLNLGAALAEQGKRVLLIDCDPQGNLTQALNASTTGPTLYSEMRTFLDTYTPTLDRATQSTGAGVDVIPTDVRLNLSNGELTLAMHGEFILQKLLRPIAPRYDFVLLDTLPYLGVLVVNTLVAAQIECSISVANECPTSPRPPRLTRAECPARSSGCKRDPQTLAGAPRERPGTASNHRRGPGGNSCPGFEYHQHP